jgi:hypothetical protein
MNRIVCVLAAFAALAMMGAPAAAAAKPIPDGLKGCRTLAKVYDSHLTFEQQVLVAGDALTHLQKVRNVALLKMLRGLADNADSPSALGNWCKTRYAKDATVAASTYAPATTTTTTMPPEYPKEVPIDSIEDTRVRDFAQQYANGNTTVIEVAPGVYANKGHQPLGPMSLCCPSRTVGC